MSTEGNIVAAGERPVHPGSRAGFLVALALVSVVVPVLVARHYGALGIPRGDDWSYIQTLFRLVDHGRLDGNRWLSMTLLGQVGTTVPVVWVFGHDISALQITTALMGFGGLVCTYWLGTRLIGAGPAALVTITLAAGPLWGPLAVSYMTDVPAFAATMLALGLGLAAMREPPLSMGLFVASLAAGVLAFSIRQYGVVALVAIIVTAVWAGHGDARGRRRSVILLSIGSLAACAAIYIAWSRIPNLKTYVPAVPDGHSLAVTVIKGGGFVRLAGLLLLPVVAWAGPATIVRRAWSTSRRATAVVGGALMLALAVLSVRVPGQQFVGNYIDSDGALSTNVLLGRRPDLFPASVYGILVALATISGVLIVLSAVGPAFALVGRLRNRDWSLPDPATFCIALATVGYSFAYAFAMMTEVSVYDRYAFPVLPLIAIALLRSNRAEGAVTPFRERDRGPGRRVWCAVALALTAAIGLAFTLDAASFDGTRWKVAVAATRDGFARREINGGFEWVNFYRGSQAPRIVVGTSDANAAPTVKLSEFCVSVYVDPARDSRRVLTSRAYSIPFRSGVRMVALRNRCRTP